MFTSETGRFIAALGVLTAGFVALQSTIGGNIGLMLAVVFAFLYLVRNSDLWQYIARPFAWAAGLLE